MLTANVFLIGAFLLLLLLGTPIAVALGLSGVAGILTGPDMHGYALVNLFAPDVLVIQGIGSPPLVLARCTG